MESSDGLLAGIGTAGMLIYLAVIALVVVSQWKVFIKAQEAGWASLIPIYNTMVMLRIVGRPMWWILLMLIPIVNIVILVMVMLELATAFGKSAGYGIGLLLLPIVFFPMLAFGDAVYEGPVAH